jgi:hypothetical protein
LSSRVILPSFTSAFNRITFCLLLSIFFSILLRANGVQLVYKFLPSFHVVEFGYIGRSIF